jgi:FtsP/CotA-like multicopper oxidase with cupredoxin domain
MRMDPTGLSDVTGDTYTYLLNGLPPEANWTALFRPSERVRLRVINGSTMPYFNVRMPGLAMTAVQANEQNVEPTEDRAFTIFAEAMDRSCYTRGTLAPRAGMSAAIPQPAMTICRHLSTICVTGPPLIGSSRRPSTSIRS